MSKDYFLINSCGLNHSWEMIYCVACKTVTDEKYADVCICINVGCLLSALLLPVLRETFEGTVLLLISKYKA